MESDYYYSREGQRFGPVPGDELKRLASTGQLQPNDLIWKEGMASWVPAARVKGLFPAAAPAPAPAPTATATAEPPELTVAPVAAPHPSQQGDPLASYRQPEPSAPQADAGEAARILARQAKDAAMTASKDALKGFKVLIRNPVGGLREAFEALGPTAALGVGVVFSVIFAVCTLLGFWLGPGGIGGFSPFFKDLLFVAVPVAAAIGGCFAAQKLFRGEGGIQADVFIAGASLLPLGAAVLIRGVLASHNMMIVAAVQLFGFTTASLMTYSGCTSLLRVPDVVATIVVPLAFVVDAVAAHFLDIPFFF